MLNKSIIDTSLERCVNIAGTGTIGTGQKKVLDSIGIQSVFSKYSGALPKDFEILPENYGTIGLIDGLDVGKRWDEMTDNGLSPTHVIGNITENGFPRVQHEVNLCCATAKGSKYNIENEIFDGTLHIVQGGTDNSDGKFLQYVSAPGTNVFNEMIYTDKIKQLSCNATITATMFGLINEALKLDGNSINNAIVIYQRRFADPDELNKTFKPETQKFLEAPKYVFDITSVLPFLASKLTCYANKNDWREFHHSTARVHFDQPFNLESIKQVFRNYHRCVLIEDPDTFVPMDAKPDDIKRAQEYFINTIERNLGIKDGDIGIGIYAMRKTSDRDLEIYMENPQQSITFYSTMDLLLSTAFKHLLIDGNTPYEQNNLFAKHHNYRAIEKKYALEDVFNHRVH